MHENISILLKMGFTILIAGTLSSYLDGLLLSKALARLQLVNAQMSYYNFRFIDVLSAGFVLIIFSLALKRAVHAVEENKNTI
ncbi:hypothetical protein [Virgibacillus necropolis]|uniref:Uncharacterized protein n=1 Tax=Virgibacillus necropolis TaxID=163877 RepID=A0A221MF52_9BACI|nr:hypothetical protein [Virgibacillus necropolis]ASN06252.1 hypothetical protein CFK40_15095 [Virgibacillus necropolis]